MEEVLKPDEAEAAIEALLFTMGEAISAEAIGAVIGHDKATVIRLVPVSYTHLTLPTT